MGYKTKSMIYAKGLKFGIEEKEQTGMKTPFDVNLPGVFTEKFEGKPFVKSEKEKKKPGAYSQGAKLLDETSQNDVVLSGLTSQDWGTRLGTSLGIMVNKIRKNKKQKNLSEGKGKGKGFTGGTSNNPSNNNISIPVAGNEGSSLGTPPSNSMSDSYFKTKIAAERANSYLGSFKKKSIPTPKDETNRLNIDVFPPIKTKPVSPFVNPTKNIGIVPRKEKTNKELKKHFKKEGRKKNNKKIDNQESKYSADFSKFSTKEFPEQITAVGLSQDLTKKFYLNNAKEQGFTRDQAMKNVKVTQQTDGYRAYKYEMGGGKNPAFYEETPKKKSLFGRKKQ